MAWPSSRPLRVGLAAYATAAGRACRLRDRCGSNHPQRYRLWQMLPAAVAIPSSHTRSGRHPVKLQPQRSQSRQPLWRQLGMLVSSMVVVMRTCPGHTPIPSRWAVLKRGKSPVRLYANWRLPLYRNAHKRAGSPTRETPCLPNRWHRSAREAAVSLSCPSRCAARRQR